MWLWCGLTSISFTLNSSICCCSATAWSVSSSRLLSSSALIRSSASLRAAAHSFSYWVFSSSSVASCYVGPHELRSVTVTRGQQRPSSRSVQLLPKRLCQSRPVLGCAPAPGAHCGNRGTEMRSWGTTQHSAKHRGGAQAHGTISRVRPHLLFLFFLRFPGIYHMLLVKVRFYLRMRRR